MILPGIGSAIMIGTGSNFPARRGSVATTSGTGSSVSVTLPTHQAGDLLIAVVSTLGGRTITPSGSWTTDEDVAIGTTRRVAVYSLVAASSSETLTVTLTGSGSGFGWAVIAYAISGSDGTVEGAAVASIDPPSLTTSWGTKATFWLAVACTETTPATAPTGFSNLTQVADPASTFGILSTSERQEQVGTKNPSSFGTAGTNPITLTIAVKPSA